MIIEDLAEAIAQLIGIRNDWSIANFIVYDVFHLLMQPIHSFAVSKLYNRTD